MKKTTKTKPVKKAIKQIEKPINIKCECIKEFMVFDKDGSHEYDITVEEITIDNTNTNETTIATLFTLSLSNGEQWSEHVKGEKQLTMLDTGDGIKFTPALEDIDYAQLTYLRLLIGVDIELDTNNKNLDKYNIIERKSSFQL